MRRSCQNIFKESGKRTVFLPDRPWLATVLLASLVASAFHPPSARAGDEPFTGPNNHGLTGLLEIPTARVMTENRFRLGATHVRPYGILYGTVGLFDRLEVNGRIT